MPPPSLIPPPRPPARLPTPSVPRLRPTAFEPAPIPPDIEDIPPESGERLNDVRADPIAAVERDRKESSEPPPIRLGMNPSNIPA
jgi:hypothetical protein